MQRNVRDRFTKNGTVQNLWEGFGQKWMVKIKKLTEYIHENHILYNKLPESVQNGSNSDIDFQLMYKEDIVFAQKSYYIRQGSVMYNTVLQERETL